MRDKGQNRRRDLEYAELVAGRSAAEARALGDHQLRYWAGWAKDIGGPQKAKSCMTIIADMAERRYADEHRPAWLDDVALAVGMAVLALPPKEQEAVWACYMRIRWKRVAGAEWAEPVRCWHDEECAEKLGISKPTWYRRLAGARARIEAAVEAAGVVVP